MARFQRGSLRVESRKNGDTWVLRYFTTREVDGRRVEHTLPVGLVRDFASESAAWREVEHQGINQQINQPGFRGRLTFVDLAHHYMKNELSEQADTVDPKAHTTIYIYRHILNDYLVPRWGKRTALGIEPLEIEKWFQALRREKGLANPTLDKTRRVMSLVYKHSQRHGLIPRGEECNPLRFVRCKTTSDYEAIILTPAQSFAVLGHLPEPERTLTLLAAGTGLRISECLGLQWQDVNFADQMIHVRRTWVHSRLGHPKTKASKAPVPMHALLAASMKSWHQESPFSRPDHWVFPRVQNLLRHSNVKTTLQLYAHSVSDDRLAAQGQALAAFLQPPVTAAVN